MPVRDKLRISHYIIQIDLVKARFRKLLTPLENKTMEWVNAKVTANFSLPLLGYKTLPSLIVELLVLRSRLNRNFLDN